MRSSELRLDRAGRAGSRSASSGTSNRSDSVHRFGADRAGGAPWSAPVSLGVSGLTSAAVGSAQTVKVTALIHGKVNAGYRGTVVLIPTDAQAALPAQYTFKSADKGVHSFPVTLKTNGSQQVTATDAAASPYTGSQTVTVSPDPARAFALALLGALLGVAGAYLTLAATYLDDLDYLGPIPVVPLLLMVVGIPLTAAAAGWLLAGRDYAARHRVTAGVGEVTRRSPCRRRRWRCRCRARVAGSRPPTRSATHRAARRPNRRRICLPRSRRRRGQLPGRSGCR